MLPLQPKARMGRLGSLAPGTASEWVQWSASGNLSIDDAISDWICSIVGWRADWGTCARAMRHRMLASRISLRAGAARERCGGRKLVPAAPPVYCSLTAPTNALPARSDTSPMLSSPVSTLSWRLAATGSFSTLVRARWMARHLSISCVSSKDF